MKRVLRALHPRREPDTEATRRATLAIGWQIMAASAMLVLGVLAVAAIFIVHQSLPSEQIQEQHNPSPHIYVDIDDVFQALVIVGIGAVIFAGLVSWAIAGRAVRPLGLALRLQRDFVSDASHELRTPLAVLDARLQVLQRRLKGGAALNSTESAQMIAALRADSGALIDVVNDLLLAAAVSPETDKPAPIDAGAAVADAVESLRILAGSRRVDLILKQEDAVQVRMPAPSLRRCVVALVDNAVSHAPDGSRVTVRVSAAHGDCVLTVADEGTGITGISPERIFERFAHSDETPTSGTPPRRSFGLGLALVRDIATRQGGRVRVAETSSAGTTMLLELPAVI